MLANDWHMRRTSSGFKRDRAGVEQTRAACGNGRVNFFFFHPPPLPGDVAHIGIREGAGTWEKREEPPSLFDRSLSLRHLRVSGTLHGVRPTGMMEII